MDPQQLIEAPVAVESMGSTKSTKWSTRSIGMASFRKTSLLLMLSSLSLTVVALIKQQFLFGTISVTNYGRLLVHLGMFQTCTSSSLYECSAGLSNLWTPVVAQWRAASAMLLIETLCKFAAFYLMVRRPVLKSPLAIKTVKYALPIMLAVCSITGLIAVSLAGSTLNRLENRSSGIYQVWAFDVSMYLMIASYPLSIFGYLLYCLGWRMEEKLGSDSLLQPWESIQSNGSEGIVQSQQVMPQQVAITINGQTMMATLTPVQPQHLPTAAVAPVIADNNYVPPNPATHMVYANYPTVDPTVPMNAQPITKVYQHPQYNQAIYSPYGHGVQTTSL